MEPLMHGWRREWTDFLEEFHLLNVKDIAKDSFVDGTVKKVAKWYAKVAKDDERTQQDGPYKFDVEAEKQRISDLLTPLVEHVKGLVDSRDIALRPKRVEHALAMEKSLNGDYEEPTEKPDEFRTVELYREFNDFLGADNMQRILERDNGVLKSMRDSRASLIQRVQNLAGVTLQDFLNYTKTEFRKEAEENGATLSKEFLDAITGQWNKLFAVDKDDAESVRTSPFENVREIIHTLDALADDFDVQDYLYPYPTYWSDAAPHLSNAYRNTIQNFDIEIELEDKDRKNTRIEKIAKQTGVSKPLADSLDNAYKLLQADDMEPQQYTIANVLHALSENECDELFEEHLSQRLDDPEATRYKERVREVFDLMQLKTQLAIQNEYREEYDDIIGKLGVPADYSLDTEAIVGATNLPEYIVDALKETYDALEVDGTDVRPYVINADGTQSNLTTGAQILISTDSAAEEFHNEYLQEGLSAEGEQSIQLLFNQTIDRTRLSEIKTIAYFSNIYVYPLVQDASDPANAAILSALETRAGTVAEDLWKDTKLTEIQHIKFDENYTE